MAGRGGVAGGDDVDRTVLSGASVLCASGARSYLQVLMEALQTLHVSSPHLNRSSSSLF